MSGKRTERYWLGVDLGGTKMLAVVFDDAMKPIAEVRARTRGHEGAAAGLKRLCELIGEALAAAKVAASAIGSIGIACPGPLDLDSGIVLEMPNLGWRRTPVRAEVETAFGCPAFVANDVDAGVYGEYRFGAGRKARCLLGAFIGTGIGGGLVYEGKILRGRSGSCVEIGHIPVLRDGPLCGCGRRGCLEAVCGRLAISAAAAVAAYRGEAPNLMKAAGTDVSKIRSRVLADAIAAGDRAIEVIVCEAAETIGLALAGVVNVLAPDTIVLGGGLVEDMPKLFRREVNAALRRRVMPSFADTFEVVVAGLAGKASVQGAAAWARWQVEQAAAGG